MKKLSFLLFGLLLLLAACGTSGNSNGSSNEPAENTNGSNAGETSEETKSYKVGITQIVEHPSLDAATQGFIDAVEASGLDVEFVEEQCTKRPKYECNNRTKLSK